MSFSETLLVVIICVFLLKPEDIPIIIKKFIEIKNYLLGVKEEISRNLSHEILPEIDSNFAEINKYLEKIIEIEGSYDGEYTLESIKKKYISIMRKKDET